MTTFAVQNEILVSESNYSLQYLNDSAYRAFCWTSFSPRERGQRCVNEHEAQLKADLENMPETEKARYIENYKKLFSSWLSAHSNCASSAITGGSGFNVTKANKANNREHARYQEFIEWREKALKAIAKRIEESKPIEQKNSEEWQRLESQILSSAQTIYNIIKGIERGYNKALFVSSIYGKVETFAKRGDIEMVKRAIEAIRNFNATKCVVITEKHKFFGLLEVAEANQAKETENQTKENSEVEFTGGKVVQNWADNRIQILFDTKPEKDVIEFLKKRAFRWAPSVGAWQRQNTGNTVHAIKEFLSFIKAKN